MTEIERKALALVNEVCRETDWPTYGAIDRDYPFTEALCRAIEQHEAYKQEVSDAVELANMRVKELKRNTSYIVNHMQQYIIPKPVDPLVEALAEATGQGENYIDERDANALRAAIEKRGGKIVWGEKQ